jgi:carbon monoxide dehydrogenase subunit G
MKIGGRTRLKVSRPEAWETLTNPRKVTSLLPRGEGSSKRPNEFGGEYIRLHFQPSGTAS